MSHSNAQLSTIESQLASLRETLSYHEKMQTITLPDEELDFHSTMCEVIHLDINNYEEELLVLSQMAA